MEENIKKTSESKKGKFKEAIKKVIKKVTPEPKAAPKNQLNRQEVFKDLNIEFAQMHKTVVGLSRQSQGGMAARLNRVSRLLSQSMKMLK